MMKKFTVNILCPNCNYDVSINSTVVYSGMFVVCRSCGFGWYYTEESPIKDEQKPLSFKAETKAFSTLNEVLQKYRAKSSFTKKNKFYNTTPKAEANRGIKSQIKPSKHRVEKPRKQDSAPNINQKYRENSRPNSHDNSLGNINYRANQEFDSDKYLADYQQNQSTYSNSRKEASLNANGSDHKKINSKVNKNSTNKGSSEKRSNPHRDSSASGNLHQPKNLSMRGSDSKEEKIVDDVKNLSPKKDLERAKDLIYKKRTKLPEHDNHLGEALMHEGESLSAEGFKDTSKNKPLEAGFNHAKNFSHYHNTHKVNIHEGNTPEVLQNNSGAQVNNSATTLNATNASSNTSESQNENDLQAPKVNTKIKNYAVKPEEDNLKDSTIKLENKLENKRDIDAESEISNNRRLANTSENYLKTKTLQEFDEKLQDKTDLGIKSSFLLREDFLDIDKKTTKPKVNTKELLLNTAKILVNLTTGLFNFVLHNIIKVLTTPALLIKLISYTFLVTVTLVIFAEFKHRLNLEKYEIANTLTPKNLAGEKTSLVEKSKELNPASNIMPDDALPTPPANAKSLHIVKTKDDNKVIAFEKNPQQQKNSQNPESFKGGEGEKPKFTDELKSTWHKQVFNVKQIKANLFQDLKVYNNKTEWSNVRDKTLYASTTLLNTNKDSAYLIRSLEVLFTDQLGNIVGKRTIIANQLINNNSSLNIKLTINGAPSKTYKTYIFIKDKTKL